MPGGVDLRTSPNARNSPTPEPPSLAPGVGSLRNESVDDFSATGRESQCVTYNSRSSAIGLKRARTLRSGSFAPLCVVCVQVCSMTVSARWRICAAIQSPARLCASVPGTRAPKSMNVRTYPRARSPSNGLATVASPRPQPPPCRTASIRMQSVDIFTSQRSTEELNVQRGRDERLRKAPVEVPVERHDARRLQAERNVI